MGRITTHVLDVASGTPARGVRVTLYARDDKGGALTRVAEASTNAEGRCDAPLVEGDALKRGRYRLCFAIGAYFAARGVASGDLPFLDEVVVDFGVDDASGHYHVPLVASPWSYSTYRGS
jgi:5-hydroxyisourate hydrolase